MVTASNSRHSDRRRRGAVALVQRKPAVRVLVGDGDPLASQAVAALLSAESSVSVIGCESDSVALTRAIKRLSPSVLVVDLGQRQFSGADSVAYWIGACPRIVVLTTDLTPDVAVEFLRTGVRGLIDKADPSLLPLAVLAAAAGDILVTPSVATPMVDHWRATVTSAPAAMKSGDTPAGGPLTHRERAVLVLMAAGHTSAEAARQLGVSAGTLQGHMHQVIKKLKVKDRTQAVAWAYLSGLCPVPPGQSPAFSQQSPS